MSDARKRIGRSMKHVSDREFLIVVGLMFVAFVVLRLLVWATA